MDMYEYIYIERERDYFLFIYIYLIIYSSFIFAYICIYSPWVDFRSFSSSIWQIFGFRDSAFGVLSESVRLRSACLLST